MTRIETSRVSEMLGIAIATVQEAAQRLDAGSDLQELEANLTALEKRIAELKGTLAGLPYRRS